MKPKIAQEENASNLHLATLAIHAGRLEGIGAGAVSPPLILSTTFERDERGEFGPYVYTRANNPNREAAERKLAALEGGAEAIAFASGQTATMSVFQAVLAPGSHLIIPDDCYHGTRALLAEVFNDWHLAHTEVDCADLEAIAAAIRPNTRLIWLETPSNPQLKIADIAAVVALARQHQLLVGCDNTWATPFFQRPLALGVDIVVHAATKYLGGHSDLLGGCVIFRAPSALSTRLRAYQEAGGAVLSPFDSWLLWRSLATFPLRMPVHAANAMAIARYLDAHPRIERVFYPGLPSHPQHEIARRQMRGGFGGMLSVLVKGGKDEAMRLAGSLRLFRHATSLGGVESLVEHRRTSEGKHPKSPDELLRFSVGIEHVDDLLADLKQALYT
jgi:cystathionine gamma-synthase